MFGLGSNQYGELGFGTEIQQLSNFQLIPNLSGTILGIATGETYSYTEFGRKVAGAHTIVYNSEGLFCSGSNADGQLGFGKIKSVSQFTPVTGLSGKILQATTSATHTLVLTTQGLFGSGSNAYGQLNISKDSVNEFTPIPLEGLSGKIVKVVAGNNYTLIQTSDGFFGCGSNYLGILGLGFIEEVRQFTRITGLNGQILDIAPAQDFYTLVLTTNGLFGSGHKENKQDNLLTESTRIFQRIPIPDDLKYLIKAFRYLENANFDY